MGTGADPAGRWRRDDVLPEDMKEAGAGAKPTSALNLLNLDPVQHFFVDVLADTMVIVNIVYCHRSPIAESNLVYTTINGINLIEVGDCYPF